MGRVLVFILIAGLIVGVVARGAIRARRARRAAEQPEINKHPERLDQSLDPTDDA